MDKKTLSAFGLIFLVIMAYQYLILPRVMPPPPPPAVDAPAGAPSDSVVPSAPPVPAETTVALPEDLPPSCSVYRFIVRSSRAPS